jgi:hypothetical protein
MRTSVTLGAFAVGLVLGLGAIALQPPVPRAESPYPALGAVPEPAEAAAIASHVRSGDASTLAMSLDQAAIEGLSRAIGVIPIIEDVRFSGAAAVGDSIVAGYLVYGSDGTNSLTSGFTVAVDSSGTVIAIR